MEGVGLVPKDAPKGIYKLDILAYGLEFGPWAHYLILYLLDLATPVPVLYYNIIS